MLIQRSPPCSMSSTLGSGAVGAAALVSTRVRDGRRSRGFGRFGIGSQRVVDWRRHREGFYPRPGRPPASLYPSPLHIAVRIERGGGTWPCETPATIRLGGNGAKSIRLAKGEPGRCDRALRRLRHRQTAEITGVGGYVRRSAELQRMRRAVPARRAVRL